MNLFVALATVEAGLTIGLVLVLIFHAARQVLRRHVLLMAASYLILLSISVEMVASYADVESPRFWLAVVAWTLGDAGLLVYIYSAAHRRVELDAGGGRRRTDG